MIREPRLVLVPLFAALGMGCAPALMVQVRQPAPVNLGAARKLSVVQTEGLQRARELVLAELMEQAHADGYFTLADRSGEGAQVKRAGPRVEVRWGRGASQAPDEIGLRLEVLEWSARTDTRIVRKTVQEKDPSGKEVSREIEQRQEVQAGKVVLGVTAFDARGRPLLGDRQYEARAYEELEEPALKKAAKQAVGKLLHDITPGYFTWFIRMDEEDELQRPILRIAEAGDVPYALEEMRKFLNGHPQSASARYNLAALLDASGRYREALELYEQALSGGKDYYPHTRSECEKRLAAQQALAR